jgi:hypothetical protein
MPRPSGAGSTFLRMNVVLSISTRPASTRSGYEKAPRVRILVTSIEPRTRGRRRRMEVARYGQAFKDRAVARLLPPESAALEMVAGEVGIGPVALPLAR